MLFEQENRKFPVAIISKEQYIFKKNMYSVLTVSANDNCFKLNKMNHEVKDNIGGRIIDISPGQKESVQF